MAKSNGWNKFWNFQKDVGRAGAQINVIGAVIGAVILCLFGLALIVAGILAVQGKISIMDDSTPKSDDDDLDASYQKELGAAMIVFGVFLLVMAGLSVWASRYWNKAVKKNSNLAKAGGFMFEYQLLKGLFN